MITCNCLRSPRLVGWCGLNIIVGWTIVLFWVMDRPGVFYDLGLPDESGIRAYAARYANPFYFPLSKWLIEVFAVGLLTFGLSIAVARSRRLVGQATTAERARANLARHFSPNLVETLSMVRSDPEAPPRVQAAVPSAIAAERGRRRGLALMVASWIRAPATRATYVTFPGYADP